VDGLVAGGLEAAAHRHGILEAPAHGLGGLDRHTPDPNAHTPSLGGHAAGQGGHAAWPGSRPPTKLPFAPGAAPLLLCVEPTPGAILCTPNALAPALSATAPGANAGTTTGMRGPPSATAAASPPPLGAHAPLVAEGGGPLLRKAPAPALAVGLRSWPPLFQHGQLQEPHLQAVRAPDMGPGADLLLQTLCSASLSSFAAADGEVPPLFAAASLPVVPPLPGTAAAAAPPTVAAATPWSSTDSDSSTRAKTRHAALHRDHQGR
jgi:hypothetical protein